MDVFLGVAVAEGVTIGFGVTIGLEEELVGVRVGVPGVPVTVGVEDGRAVLTTLCRVTVGSLCEIRVEARIKAESRIKLSRPRPNWTLVKLLIALRTVE